MGEVDNIEFWSGKGIGKVNFVHNDLPISFFMILQGTSIVATTNLPSSFPIPFDTPFPILNCLTFVFKLKYCIFIFFIDYKHYYS